VINAPNLYGLFRNPVHDNVGQGHEQKFPRSFYAPRSANIRRILQGANFLIQLAQGRLAVLWMVLLEISLMLCKSAAAGGVQRIRI
jgi:hypothetical protein